MMNTCPLCQTREILRKMLELLDEAPEINSAFYDDVTADLSNQISNALSTFQCMCDELEPVK